MTNQLIVLCGMDGTGKTTLASLLRDYLKKKGIESNFVHAHGYSVSQNSFSLDEQKVRNFRVFFSLLLPLALIDNYISYSRYRKLLKKSTVIFDRYLYDKVSRMMFYGIINKFFARLYLYLLPKPDYAFILTASPDTVYKRKHEYELEEYRVFKKNYEFIAETLKIPIINTELPVEDCLKKIISITQL